MMAKLKSCVIAIAIVASIVVYLQHAHPESFNPAFVNSETPDLRHDHTPAVAQLGHDTPVVAQLGHDTPVVAQLRHDIPVHDMTQLRHDIPVHDMTQQLHAMGELRMSLTTNVCIKGQEMLDPDWIKQQLGQFLQVYDKRPVCSNEGGTKLMHQFALWCIIRSLQPQYIIESGIYRGLGTWMLRQAAPNAKMILVSPNSNGLAYRDEAPDTVYLTDKKFIDFKNVIWSDYVEPEKTLVFIDDHQSAVRRTAEAHKAGFRHLVFDDNYFLSGDVTSLKTACELILGKVKAERVVFNDNFNRVRRPMTEDDVQQMKEVFDNLIESYYEFPMIWLSTKGKSNVNSTNYIFDRKDAGEEILKEYGSTNIPPPSEIGGFCNIAYVKLRQP